MKSFKSSVWATQETVQEGCEGMVCKSCGDEYGKPTNEKCMYDSKDPKGKNWINAETKNEAMDPVNKKELKGKHADRKDKDIDNDGDADASDKYLHKRRKAISKAMEDTNKEGYYKDLEIKKQDKAMGAKPVPNKKKKEASGGGKEGDVTMNPKMETSKIRESLLAVLAEKENHSPNKDKAEKIKDARKGKGAEDMMKDADAEVAKGPDAHLNEPEIDKKNFQNMTKNVPSASGNAVVKKANKGDSKIKPAGTQFKDPNAMKPETAPTPFKAESYDKTAGIRAAYASMYEKEGK